MEVNENTKKLVEDSIRHLVENQKTKAGKIFDQKVLPLLVEQLELNNYEPEFIKAFSLIARNIYLFGVEEGVINLLEEQFKLTLNPNAKI